MSEGPLSWEAVVQTAIEREREAQELYLEASEKVKAGEARELLHDLAAQEEGHRRRLERLLAGQISPEVLARYDREIVDLRITDFLQEVPLDERSDVQQVLIVAGKREAGSHALYAALADACEDDEVAALFQFLATEELEHKQRIERLYEELFYSEI